MIQMRVCNKNCADNLSKDVCCVCLGWLERQVETDKRAFLHESSAIFVFMVVKFQDPNDTGEKGTCIDSSHRVWWPMCWGRPDQESSHAVFTRSSCRALLEKSISPVSHMPDAETSCVIRTARIDFFSLSTQRYQLDVEWCSCQVKTAIQNENQ